MKYKTFEYNYLNFELINHSDGVVMPRETAHAGSVSLTVKSIIEEYMNREEKHSTKFFDELLSDFSIEKHYLASTRYFENYGISVSYDDFVNELTIKNINRMVKRFINCVNNQVPSYIYKNLYIFGNKVYYIVVLKGNPNFSESIHFITQAFTILYERGLDYKTIDYVSIFNLRTNEEWRCNTNAEHLPSQQEIDKSHLFESIQDDCEDYLKCESLINELIAEHPSIKIDSIYPNVIKLQNKYNCSFDDALDEYVYYYGKQNSRNTRQNEPVVFRGKNYSTRRSAYKRFLPKLDPAKVSSAVSQRMSHQGLDWEEALELTIEKEREKKKLVYKGKNYSTKKELLEEQFPNTEYSNICVRINSIMKKYDCNIAKAIEYAKKDTNTKGYKKEVVYNGIKYPSLRQACKALNLKPERVSHLSKKYGGDYSKAIDEILNKFSQQA